METLFQIVQLYKQSLFQKIFNQTIEENAVIELNNLLASKPLLSIHPRDIKNISSKYNIRFYPTFKRNLYEFYAVFLNSCLKDHTLSDEDFNLLVHLKGLLTLSDHDIELIHLKIAGSLYQKKIREIIANGQFDKIEEEYLEQLQKQLRLSGATAEKLSGETRGKFLDEHLNELVAGERFSPSDEKEFYQLAKRLMIEVTLDKETKKMLGLYKLYWQIEQGELEVKDVDINLQKNERCYYTMSVDWYEQRTVTKRANYDGVGARINIMKGVYYRVGSVSGQRVTHDEWKLLDRGRVYLTNKRILFVGSKKNSTIRLDKILSFTPYSDGIQINKETGRSPLLSFSNQVDVFGLLVSRLMREV